MAPQREQHSKALGPLQSDHAAVHKCALFRLVKSPTC